MIVSRLKLKIAALVIFTLACLAIFIYLFTAAGGRVRVNQPYSVTVRVPDGFQLVPNADVRRAGIRVGSVVSIDSTNQIGTLKLELDDKVAPIRRDALVQLRTKTLVGENYIELDPGSASAPTIPDGGSLPLEQADEAVQIDRILDTLDPTTRRHVRTMIRAGGRGLDGRQQALNRIFGELRPLTANGARVMTVTRQRRAHVAQLIEHTGRVLDAIGSRDAQIQTLARAARHTAEAVARRDDALREGLDAFGPFLSQARGSLDRLAGLSGRATPVVDDLADGIGALAPTLRRLSPAAQRTRALVRELPRFVRAANPLLDRLPPFSRALSPAIEPLEGVLRQANPALAYLEPYRYDIAAFFANIGAWPGIDAVGENARVHVNVGLSSLDVTTPEMRKALEALLAAGGVSQFHSEPDNPYPLPGTAGEPDARSAYRQVEADPPR